jgi:hypothetical protein
MMNQEKLNFDIIVSIQEEFDHYKHMMTTLSMLIRNFPPNLGFTDDDLLGLSFLMDYITEGQEQIFKKGEEEVKKNPKYIIARAEEILSIPPGGRRNIGDFDEIIENLKDVIKVFGKDCFPKAPELLEKLERITETAVKK